MAHILPALAFVLLAPVAVLRRDAAWMKPVLLVLGTVVGVTAYAMSALAIGGRLEQSAVLLFNTLFLYWLWRAHLRDRRGDDKDARRSWIRGHPVRHSHHAPGDGVLLRHQPADQTAAEQFFGLAFWVGFSINTLAVEWWIRRQPRSVSTGRAPCGAR